MPRPIIEITESKRAGAELSSSDIATFVKGVMDGSVPDYQTSALLMAIACNGMTEDEVFGLISAYLMSGEQMGLGDEFPDAVEQMTTACVGDGKDLSLLPLVVAAGAQVIKITSPGFSVVTGIIDKIEAIPGMRTDLSRDDIAGIARKTNLVLGQHNDRYVPADTKLFHLRGVSGSAVSLPLAVASIMSEKLVSGVKAMHINVKYGRPTCIPTREDAVAHASLMASVAERFGRRAMIPLINCEAPLGNAIGSALEVRQAIEVLKGGGPAPFVEHIVAMGSQVLQVAGVTSDRDEARRLILEARDSGAGLERFAEWVGAQGGDPRVAERPDDVIESAPYTREVLAPRSGFVSSIDGLGIAQASLHIGAGRLTASDHPDPVAGVQLHANLGYQVEEGEPLFTLHSRSDSDFDVVAGRILNAYGWSDHVDPAVDTFLGGINEDELVLHV